MNESDLKLIAHAVAATWNIRTKDFTQTIIFTDYDKVEAVIRDPNELRACGFGYQANKLEIMLVENEKSVVIQSIQAHINIDLEDQ